MFISKKKLNELCNRIDKQQKEINDLAECHIFNYTPYFDIDSGNHSYKLIKSGYIHEEVKVDTESVKNVTLLELAKLIIDNEPIVREETINIKKEYR